MTDNTTIFNDHFLLHNEAGKNLFFNYAKDLPIIDYHNHLPPAEIAENKKFTNLTQIWLKGDHYKWRAMRALGVKESLITGDATDEEKFLAWAACMPKLLRNPLFQWSQMELKNPFGVDEYLNPASAQKIYAHCNELLQEDSFSTKSLLKGYNVEMLGTTDDPLDDLAFHKKIAEDGFSVKVFPSFRPDRFLNISNRNAFLENVGKLENIANTNIRSFDGLLAALEKRVDFFHQMGCRVSDHGLNLMPSKYKMSKALEDEFNQFIANDFSDPYSSPDTFAGAVLFELSKMYHARGWVQQFHLGAIRNNNTRLLKQLGADAGVDSIGDFSQAVALSNFLNGLDSSDQLAKTILYNLNPADNELMATMCGNFSDGTTKGKMQFGSGWWFLDQRDGIINQLNALSNMGVVSNFVGMITDSRSFLSYSRHDYFRRVLCNLFGEEMENGLLPNDEAWIGGIIKDICYYNAKDYFSF
jgi:glucuronate isomerase